MVARPLRTPGPHSPWSWSRPGNPGSTGSQSLSSGIPSPRAVRKEVVRGGGAAVPGCRRFPGGAAPLGCRLRAPAPTDPLRTEWLAQPSRGVRRVDFRRAGIGQGRVPATI